MTGYTLGGLTYRTQADVATACKNLLRWYPGTTLDERATAFLTDLLAMHPDAEQKIGVGIDHFEIRKNRGFPSNGFYLVRVDGSETDFSYRKCLCPPTDWGRAMAALRYAVEPQIRRFVLLAFRDGPVVCELSGVLMRSPSEAEVDHGFESFAELAAKFVELEGGLDVIELAPQIDGKIGARMADTAQRERWREYHEQHAFLNVVAPSANRPFVRY
jgi:hypothetical protein